MQVLSRVLSYGVGLGAIAGNPCEGIKALYSGDRSEIIWTDADMSELKQPAEPKKGCAREIADAVDLAGAHRAAVWRSAAGVMVARQ